VLSSQAFSESPVLARLLKYLCSNHFNENKSTLNEYKIGVEALGRPADFDPATNSSVRVEMHRLRARLRKYYETEGADHTFRIMVMEGRYELQFTRREDRLAASSDKQEETGRSADLRKKWIAYKTVAIPAVVIVILLISFWMVFGVRSCKAPGHTSAVLPSSEASSAPAVTPVNGSVRILAGYSKREYLDRDGNAWSGDHYFTGGEVVDLKLSYIQGTSDPTMYRTAREGEFSYDIPLNPGSYELRLHFVETAFGPGTFTGRGESSRVFSVFLGEHPLLPSFDILSDAGGNFRALTRVFKNVSPGSDGMVHLKFRRWFDQPMVNAIELVPEVGGRLNPVRIVMQENSYVDHAGQLWSSDQYAVGGVLVTHLNPAVNVSDSHLFDGERFGHFDYQIPVTPGRYTVTLYFTEGFFGTVSTRHDDAPRIFDVSANGVALLRNFNIFEKAGGPNQPVIETFHGIVPNTAGLIALSFVPVKNYACVSAIEVTEESQ
jgi:hypothetical protein